MQNDEVVLHPRKVYLSQIHYQSLHWHTLAVIHVTPTSNPVMLPQLSLRRARIPIHRLLSVDVVYSSETCADAWIEKEVVALREDGCPKVWVITSDHNQQHAAYGAIKASHKEVERMLREHRSTSMQGKLLKHNLDAEVVDALKDLRDQLSQNETHR